MSFLAFGSTTLQDSTSNKKQRGIPKYNDVSISSRWVYPSNLNDRKNTFMMVDSFFANRIDWVYSRDSSFYKKAHQKECWVSAAINAIIPDTIGGLKTMKGRILNLDGKMLTAPWMKNFGENRANWGCVNNPEFAKNYFEHIRAALLNGADAIHVDDARLNHHAFDWGGCYCTFCVAGFNSFLKKRKGSNHQTTPLDFDASNSNIRDYLIGKGYNGTKLPSIKVEPILKYYFEFQSQSVLDFFNLQFRLTEEFAQTKIVFSCNNYKGSWTPPYSLFDFGIAELPAKNANPEFIHEAMFESTIQNKKQGFTLLSTDVELNQKCIALTYACGGFLIAPWDVNMSDPEKPSLRHYGKATDYSSYYKFIRENAKLFEFPHEVYSNIPEKSKQGQKNSQPILISASDSMLFIFARMDSSDENTKAVHLINWNNSELDNVRVRFKENKFTMNNQNDSLLFFCPEFPPKKIPIHRSSDSSYIEVPKFNRWAILYLEKKK